MLRFASSTEYFPLTLTLSLREVCVYRASPQQVAGTEKTSGVRSAFAATSAA